MPTLPPGPRARLMRAAGQGSAAAKAGEPATVNPYDRATFPATRAAWSLGYARGRAELNEATRPATLSEQITYPEDADGR